MRVGAGVLARCRKTQLGKTPSTGTLIFIPTSQQALILKIKCYETLAWETNHKQWGHRFSSFYFC